MRLPVMRKPSEALWMELTKMMSLTLIETNFRYGAGDDLVAGPFKCMNLVEPRTIQAYRSQLLATIIQYTSF